MLNGDLIKLMDYEVFYIENHDLKQIVLKRILA